MHWFANEYAVYGGETTVDVTQYHVYSVECDEAGITWKIDGIPFHSSSTLNYISGTEEFHHSFFIILSMAIGGNWPGFAVNNSALPATMFVDYVRVYKEVPRWSVI